MTSTADGEKMMNLRFMTNKSFEKDFICEINIICHINRRNITYLSTSIDYCEPSFIAPKHLILGFILEEINRKGNIPLECPFKANFMFEVFNVSINEKFVPKFFPSLKWTTLLTFYYKNQKGLTIQLFGRLDKLKSKRCYGKFCTRKLY